MGEAIRANKAPLTPDDVEMLQRYVELQEEGARRLEGTSFAGVSSISALLRELLDEHERFMDLGTEVQEWIALPAIDDGEASYGYGVFIAGCEDEGWQEAGLTREQAETIVGLHNREFYAVQGALYPPLAAALAAGQPPEAGRPDAQP